MPRSEREPVSAAVESRAARVPIGCRRTYIALRTCSSNPRNHLHQSPSPLQPFCIFHHLVFRHPASFSRMSERSYDTESAEEEVSESFTAPWFARRSARSDAQTYNLRLLRKLHFWEKVSMETVLPPATVTPRTSRKLSRQMQASLPSHPYASGGRS